MAGSFDFCLFSERVVLPDLVAPRFLGIRGGRIEAVLEAPPAGSRVEDLGRAWLCPGLIDVHTHGLGGVAVDGIRPEGLEVLADQYPRHGVTAFVLSTLAGPEARLRETLAVGEVSPPGAAFLGFHLEGPFLNPAWSGAHDPRFCRPATRDEAGRLHRAANGRLRCVTLAPEVDPDLDVVRFFSDRGVVVSLGHSGADADLVRRAVRAGATTVTHLFNAMKPFHHREPGLVGAALHEKALACEIICDGVHVADTALCLALQVKGAGGCLLVSDSIPATGLPDGDHTLGGRPIRVRRGEARMDDGRLAGSTLTLDRAVVNAAQLEGVSMAEAVRMASTVPAVVMGEADRGRIAVGCRADLVVLDDRGACMTRVEGRTVWRRPGWNQEKVGSAEPPFS